jgi:DNA-binding CsgD family transcriptional regulator
MSDSRRAQLALLLAAIHHVDADRERWLAQIVVRATPLVGFGAGVIGCEVSARPDGRRALHLMGSRGGRRGRIPRWLAEAAASSARNSWEAIAVPSPPATTLRRLAAGLPRGGLLAPEVRGGRDALAIRGTTPDGGTGVLLLAPSRRPIRLSGRRQRMLDRIGVQLATAYQVRSMLSGRDPFALAATVLSSVGRRAVGRSPGAGGRSPAREPRGVQVAGRKGTPEAAAQIWFALLAGQWSAVDHRERDGRRLLLAVATPPAAAAALELGPDERAVLLRIAARQPLKRVASELELGMSTASALLRSALRKLRLDSPSEAIRIFSTGPR